MGEWTKWSNAERKIVIEMYKAGEKLQPIADHLNRTYNAVKSLIRKYRKELQDIAIQEERRAAQKNIAANKLISVKDQDRIRQNENKRKSGEEKAIEEAKRLECHRLGMSDKEAAAWCDIEASTYHGWRTARGLPCNRKHYQMRKPKAVEVPKERVVLTSADIVNYRHNDNTKPPTTEKIILKVDIETDLDLPEPTMPYADGPKGSYIGVVIGSKWDKDRETFTTGSKDYGNLMYKTTKNVCCKAVAHG